MSKEMAASLPVFIFVWNLCEGWKSGPEPYWRRLLGAARSAFVRDKWLYLAIALVIPAYVYYSVFLKGGSSRAGFGGFNYWGGSFYTNALTAITVHAWYLKQLVWPTPFVQYLGAFDIATTLADWRVIVSIIVVSLTIAAGFILLKRDRIMSFAILTYFVLLLPVSHIIPHHELLADHYLYLPLMSFSLLAAHVVREIARRSERAAGIAYGAAAAALIALALISVFRNTDYKDNLTLWQANYEEAPNSIRAVSSLAGIYANRDPQKAINLYKQCLEIDPSYSPAYVSLAVLLQSREKAREAEQIIQRGLDLPDSRIASPNISSPNEFRSELKTALAISRGNQGDNQTAERLLWEAIGLYPANPQPYSLLASLYRTIDRNKEIEVLKRHIAVHPASRDPIEALSVALIDLNRYDEAVPYLERLLALNSNDFFANLNLGHILRTRNDCNRARAFFMTSRSSAANPDETKAAEDAIAVLDQLCKQ
jgi:tetratricopeptide (TPR) repeat protein